LLYDMLPILTRRERQPEIMDDPGLATAQLQGALGGLARLNALSDSARIVWRPIRRLAQARKTNRLRVLDIACGAGDIPIRLWRRARRAGLTLDIVGIDISPRSVEFARQRASAAGARVAFACGNALTDPLPQDCDVALCSLFLHHLPDDDARSLLRRMNGAARHMGLVSDLRRGLYGLALAYGASRLLTRCEVVHVDAVRSVRAAFTPQELGRLAGEADLPQATIAYRWPARMLLEWHRSS
jgi:SAM-dependent methyltransferase